MGHECHTQLEMDLLRALPAHLQAEEANLNNSTDNCIIQISFDWLQICMYIKIVLSFVYFICFFSYFIIISFLAFLIFYYIFELGIFYPLDDCSLIVFAIFF